MTVERDDSEFEPWPTIDPIREAVCNLLITIMRNTADGSRERARAMSLVLDCHEKVVDAMRPAPTLQ